MHTNLLLLSVLGRDVLRHKQNNNSNTKNSSLIMSHILIFKNEYENGLPPKTLIYYIF